MESLPFFALRHFVIFLKPFPRKGMETKTIAVTTCKMYVDSFSNLFPARGWKPKNLTFGRCRCKAPFSNLFPARGWKLYFPDFFGFSFFTFSNLFPARGWKQLPFFFRRKFFDFRAFSNLFPARGWKRTQRSREQRNFQLTLSQTFSPQGDGNPLSHQLPE